MKFFNSYKIRSLKELENRWNITETKHYSTTGTNHATLTAEEKRKLLVNSESSNGEETPEISETPNSTNIYSFIDSLIEEYLDTDAHEALGTDELYEITSFVADKLIEYKIPGMTTPENVYKYIATTYFKPEMFERYLTQPGYCYKEINDSHSAEEILKFYANFKYHNPTVFNPLVSAQVTVDLDSLTPWQSIIFVPRFFQEYNKEVREFEDKRVDSHYFLYIGKETQTASKTLIKCLKFSSQNKAPLAWHWQFMPVVYSTSNSKVAQGSRLYLGGIVPTLLVINDTKNIWETAHPDTPKSLFTTWNPGVLLKDGIVSEGTFGVDNENLLKATFVIAEKLYKLQPKYPKGLHPKYSKSKNNSKKLAI
jgi:hypothetical protein